MTNNYKSIEELPVTLNADEIGKYLRISRAGAYELLNTQGFPTIRIGKRMVVPKERFVEWMNKKCGDLG